MSPQIYIPLETFFSLAFRIGKLSDSEEKDNLVKELKDLEKLVYEG